MKTFTILLLSNILTLTTALPDTLTSPFQQPDPISLLSLYTPQDCVHRIPSIRPPLMPTNKKDVVRQAQLPMAEASLPTRQVKVQVHQRGHNKMKIAINE